MKDKVIFAGAGPGAADLITLRAKKAIEEADYIIYAGSLVNPEILKYAKEKAIKINSANLNLMEVIDLMKQAVSEGKSILRLHTGDPCIYGAISEQMNELDKCNINYEVIPGVSSVFAAAAELKSELTMPGITQSVILTRISGRTPVPEQESLKKLASNDATIALFLSISELEGLTKELLIAGRSKETPIAVVYRATWGNQIIVRGTLSDIAEKVVSAGIKRQAMIIVGKALSKTGNHSLLYDKNFSHGYRKNNNFQGKTAIYAITEKGCYKAQEINEGLEYSEPFIPERFVYKFNNLNSFPKDGFTKTLNSNWKLYDAHIFVMASGIVVRKIAPLIKNKITDPAVVVCDELGNNVISLVGGHIAGANRLAKKVAGITNGNAIITTATDVNNILAFDELASIYNWKIVNPESIKTFNSILLEKRNIDVLIPEEIYKEYYSDFSNIRLIKNTSNITGDGVVLLNSKIKEINNIPVLSFKSKKYAIGIGCRKDAIYEEIDKAV